MFHVAVVHDSFSTRGLPVCTHFPLPFFFLPPQHLSNQHICIGSFTSYHEENSLRAFADLRVPVSMLLIRLKFFLHISVTSPRFPCTWRNYSIEVHLQHYHRRPVSWQRLRELEPSCCSDFQVTSATLRMLLDLIEAPNRSILFNSMVVKRSVSCYSYLGSISLNTGTHTPSES